MNDPLTALGISPDSLTARGLRPCEEASPLEIAEIGADGRNHLLIPSAAIAWRALKAAAASEGVDMFVISAFRSVERQAEIVRAKLDEGIALPDILAVCAPPGYSEHHTGRAVDVSTLGCEALEEAFENTPAYAWLSNRADDFGYRLSYPRGNASGYLYEPWHWCFHA